MVTSSHSSQGQSPAVDPATRLRIETAFLEALARPHTADQVRAELVKVLAGEVAQLRAQIRRLRVEARRRDEQIEADAARAEDAARVAVADIARHPIGDTFDPHGWFVYVLWSSDPTTPLYVGRSRNVLPRLGDHLRDPQKREVVRRVALIRCRTEWAAADTERRLIELHQPPFNIAGVDRS